MNKSINSDPEDPNKSDNLLQDNIPKDNKKPPPATEDKSAQVLAATVGGAILGNLIAPGAGGAILGGIIGAIFGKNSSDKGGK